MLSSCGGKAGKSSTSFSLNVGAIASGAALSGGVVIRGTSSLGAEFFLPTTDANNISFPLPNGVWDFYVIGWKNQAAGAMTGDNVCGAQLGVDLDGSDVAVSFNLSMANCTLAPAAGPETFTTSLPSGGFKMIDFVSCLTLAGVGADNDLCDNQDLDHMHGVSAFIKVQLKSIGNIPMPVSKLSSGCLELSTYNPPGSVDFKKSKFDTFIRLPVKNGSTIPFPVQIISYEDVGCAAEDEDITYLFPNGLAGSRGPGAASKAYGLDGVPTDDVSIRVAWADNYIGSPDSAFRAVSGTSNDAILPFINCYHATNNPTGECHNAGATAVTEVFPRDNIKGLIYELLGTPEGIESYDTVADANATVSTGGLDFTSTTLGAQGNYHFVNVQAGAFTVAISGSGIDINHPGGQTLTAVANAVNALTLTTGITATCPTSCGSAFGPANMQYDFTGGTDKFTFESRDLGTMEEIKEMLLGPIGGLLFDNGLTGINAVCATTGSFSKVIITEGTPETVTLNLSTAAFGPPNHMTVNNGSTFDRKVTLSLDGVPEMGFAFNCPSGVGGTNEMGVGWYLDKEIENGDTDVEELFFNHTTSATAAIEVVEYREEAGAIVTLEWSYFQKNSATAYDTFQLSHYAGQPWYARIGASVDMSSGGFNFQVNQYDVSTGDTFSFFSGDGGAAQSPTQSCTLTSFVVAGTCVGTPTYNSIVNPTGITGADGTDSIVLPLNLTGFSINDLEALVPGDFSGY